VVLTKQHKIFRESFILFSVLLVAFISFFIHGQEDQSAVSELTNRSESSKSWVNLIFLSDLIVYKGFGLASFLFVRLFFLTGIFFDIDISANTERNLVLGSIAIIVLSVLFGFATSVPELGGTVGYELNLFLQDYRKTGTL
jgi:S-DNA-T family DNA segregation ATPase FtsK/SpoIIIE